jgi:hypothetical protein
MTPRTPRAPDMGEVYLDPGASPGEMLSELNAHASAFRRKQTELLACGDVLDRAFELFRDLPNASRFDLLTRAMEQYQTWSRDLADEGVTL